MRRGYSFDDRDAEHQTKAFDELVTSLPYKEADLTAENPEPYGTPTGPPLLGLCAVCGADSYPELTRKTWEEFRQECKREGRLGRNWNVIVIFEGKDAGRDKEGYPLFAPKKRLVIAHINAITQKHMGLLAIRTLEGVNDFANVARCGARTRRGTHCQCPAMKNGRCRLHGGLSTGPKTVEGIERIRRAVTKHGRYSKAVREEERRFRTQVRTLRALLREYRAL